MIDMNHQATANRAADAANVLSNMTYNLAQDSQRLSEISRDLVSALGVLKKAEAAQAKLGVNATVDNKLAQICAEIDSLTRREDVASRIVAAGKKLLDDFLAEGDPTNRQLLEAAKDYESAMAEVSRL